MPQFDLIFIGHLDPEYEWPGIPYLRISRDFNQTDRDTKTVTVLLNDQLHGGIYIPDTKYWKVDRAEAKTFITTTGERILLTPKMPLQIETPPDVIQQADTHHYENMPGTDKPSRGSALAFLANLLEPADPPATPPETFSAIIEQHFSTDPPLAIFKHNAPGDPRYYLGVPERLAARRPPNVRLHLSPTRATYLYRCRMSGTNRHGIYNYIKKANQTAGTWMPDPDNDDWLLMILNVSKYVRTNLLSAFCNDGD